MMDLRTLFANVASFVQNHVIFILLNRTMRLIKAVINECKSESMARQYANVLKVNCEGCRVYMFYLVQSWFRKKTQNGREDVIELTFSKFAYCLVFDSLLRSFISAFSAIVLLTYDVNDANDVILLCSRKYLLQKFVENAGSCTVRCECVPKWPEEFAERLLTYAHFLL